MLPSHHEDGNHQSSTNFAIPLEAYYGGSAPLRWWHLARHTDTNDCAVNDALHACIVFSCSLLHGDVNQRSHGGVTMHDTIQYAHNWRFPWRDIQLGRRRPE